MDIARNISERKNAQIPEAQAAFAERVDASAAEGAAAC